MEFWHQSMRYLFLVLLDMYKNMATLISEHSRHLCDANVPFPAPFF